MWTNSDSLLATELGAIVGCAIRIGVELSLVLVGMTRISGHHSQLVKRAVATSWPRWWRQYLWDILFSCFFCLWHMHLPIISLVLKTLQYQSYKTAKNSTTNIHYSGLLQRTSVDTAALGLPFVVCLSTIFVYIPFNEQKHQFPKIEYRQCGACTV